MNQMILSLKKPKSRKHFFENFIIGLFLFFLPTQLGKHFFLDFSYVNGVRVDYLSFVLYFTDIIFLFLLIIFWKKIGRELRKNFKILLFLCFLFFLNILFSRYPFLSFYHLLRMIQFYFVFLLFKNLKKEKLFLYSVFFSTLFQFFLVVLQFVFKRSLQGIFYFFGERYLTLSTPGMAKASIEGIEILRPYGTFSHPNSLAGFYLLLYFYLLSSKQFSHFFFLKNLLLLILSLLIFFSFSKVAIITYLVVNLIYYFHFFQKKCRLCFFAKILIILSLSLIFLQAKTDPLSLEKRINLIKDSFYLFTLSPLFGLGLGHYLIYQANFPMKYPYFFLQPVHNIFLLFLVETGIILGGVIFYLLFMFIKNKMVEAKNFAFLLCLLTIFITGLFDHYWLTLIQNRLVMAVVLGLLVSAGRSSQYKPG